MQDYLKKVSSQIHQDVDDFCLRRFQQERRSHLGASEVGEECLRRQWYLFRWVRQKQFPARMLRLFNYGHREEAEFIANLSGAGWVIYTVDPVTGKQFLYSELGGHYGGSTDSLAYHPTYFPHEYLVLEFKTHKEKYFKKLVEQGVKKSNPKHFAQMSNYGARFGARFGLYCAQNKNDHNYHFELVELDQALAGDMTVKAEYIITSVTPPPRINNASPSYYQCKQCESLGPCFYKEPADKNCRSCKMATPANNADWYCQHWQTNIPKHVIPLGCDSYRSII